MNRATSVFVMSLAVVLGLHGQGIRQPIPLPPDIGPATIMVTGIGGKSVTLSVSELSNLPHQTVKAMDHGTPATFEGVRTCLPRSICRWARSSTARRASYYLVVEAKDGYRAVFAWAELDSTFMDKAVYVVTKRDGKPLSGKDGPFELVVPGEKRAARWVRQVTTLRIRQAN